MKISLNKNISSYFAGSRQIAYENNKSTPIKPNEPSNFQLNDLTHNRVMVNKSNLSFKGVSLSKTEVLVNFLIDISNKTSYDLKDHTSLIMVGNSHKALGEKAKALTDNFSNAINSIFHIRDEKIQNPFLVIIEKYNGNDNSRIINMADNVPLQVNGEFINELESKNIDLFETSVIGSGANKVRIFNVQDDVIPDLRQHPEFHNGIDNTIGLVLPQNAIPPLKDHSETRVFNYNFLRHYSNLLNSRLPEPNVTGKGFSLVPKDNLPTSWDDIEAMEPAVRELSAERLSPKITKLMTKVLDGETSKKEVKRAIEELGKEKAYDTLATIALASTNKETTFRTISELLVKKKDPRASQMLEYLHEHHPSQDWKSFIGKHLEPVHS